MNACTKYDMLEVVLVHAPWRDQAQTLASLQDAIEPRFEVEPLEHLRSLSTDHSRQTIRIASAMGEQFDSAAEFEAEIRELAGHGFAWSCIGAIRAGQAATVRG